MHEDAAKWYSCNKWYNSVCILCGIPLKLNIENVDKVFYQCILFDKVTNGTYFVLNIRHSFYASCLLSAFANAYILVA